MFFNWKVCENIATAYFGYKKSQTIHLFSTASANNYLIANKQLFQHTFAL